MSLVGFEHCSNVNCTIPIFYGEPNLQVELQDAAKSRKSRWKIFTPRKFMKIQDDKTTKSLWILPRYWNGMHNSYERWCLLKRKCRWGAVEAWRFQSCLITCEGLIPGDYQSHSPLTATPTDSIMIFHTYQVPSIEIVLVVAFQPFEIWRGYMLETFKTKARIVKKFEGFVHCWFFDTL